jgi:segregation and condensation protein B
LLESLRKRYDERGCAYQVVQVAGGYQLLSRPEFAGWLRAQAGHAEPIRLSPPALETLAVVAYRQPVLRSEVEAIRGVACGEILRQLMDRDLLRIVGRSEDLGRPLWYGTTKRFLQAFGLCNLDQLPWAQQLRHSTADISTVGEALSGEEVAHAA